MNGWAGRRLYVDLSLQRSWIDKIPEKGLEECLGGRGLNAKFFLENVPGSPSTFSPENPIAFSVGPLAGTFAPCSGWTSISVYSPLSALPRYAHVSLPGHWGPQLKFAGFDQLIVQGKADKPIYITIDGEKVKFKDAKHLWGKDIAETTVEIQDKKEDENLETLCIGPAGERLIPFANVTNRISWTGDHVGLGYVFGSKNLKAISVRGNRPVTLHHPDRFLKLCSGLREQIQRNPNATHLREEGAFFFLGRNGCGLGMKNYNESSHREVEERWVVGYLKEYLYGREGCFSCPIHCGRISKVHETYFGGVHFESAWSLGPRIGIFDWEKTLRLHRICQLQGLDPSSLGSLVSWIMDCYEKEIFLSRELFPTGCEWGDEEPVHRLIESILDGKETGEIFRQGSLGASKALGKGLELVPHFRGMDLPARDPRSSTEYALSRALFPDEWDYLQSSIGTTSTPSSRPQGSEQSETVKRVYTQQKLRILADMNSLCPLVVARLPLISGLEVGELISAATGAPDDVEWLRAVVHQTMRIEKTLLESSQGKETDPFPIRFFKDPLEKNQVEKTIEEHAPSEEPYFLSKEETAA